MFNEEGINMECPRLSLLGDIGLFRVLFVVILGEFDCNGYRLGREFSS